MNFTSGDFEKKSLRRFTCAKNACKIEEFSPHSLQLSELYENLLVTLLTDSNCFKTKLAHYRNDSRKKHDVINLKIKSI